MTESELVTLLALISTIIGSAIAVGIYIGKTNSKIKQLEKQIESIMMLVLLKGGFNAKQLEEQIATNPLFTKWAKENHEQLIDIFDKMLTKMEKKDD